MATTRHHSRPSAFLGAIAAIILVLYPLIAPPSPVLAQGINPRDLAVTDDEAGKQATRSVEQEGSDSRSAWVHLRWERNIEGPDALTGPWTVDSSVWVTQDFTTARAIFNEQADKNKSFPEAYYARGETFPLPLDGTGNQSAGLSACVDCDIKDEIMLHHRGVVRSGVVVHVVYLYGPDKVAPQALMNWYVSQLQARIPEQALTAPEVVGQAPTTEQRPAPADPLMVTADPKEIALRVEEVGKRAKLERQKSGKDARGNWYEARYERGGTGSRFYEGPVTIYSPVFVAKDVESAKQVYQEQAQLNQKFPEADKRIGDKYPLLGSDGIGDESQGLSACDRGCNLDGDVYAHKRLVFRSYNAVSVVYLYGLSGDEGNTDGHALNFSQMVLKRIVG